MIYEPIDRHFAVTDEFQCGRPLVASGQPHVSSILELSETAESANRQTSCDRRRVLHHPIREAREAGSVLDNYLLLGTLGSGGGGAIYRAVDRTTVETVAIKIPHNTAVDRHLVREIEIGRTVRHPNVVACLGSGGHDHVPYLVMEYVPGISLQELVARYGPLPVNDAVDLIRQAATGLAEVHRMGFVHRDIKPSNLLLDLSRIPKPGSPGTLKLIDFGLARRSGIESGETRGSSRIEGTIDYMAPEMAFSPTLSDPRSDLYALGCTLHFLLTGRTVYDGSAVEQLMSHAVNSVPTLSLKSVNAPEKVSDIFTNLLAKNLEQRIRSANELIVELGA